jgi:hypothetical protein
LQRKCAALSATGQAAKSTAGLRQLTHPQNVLKKREKVNMADDLVKELRWYNSNSDASKKMHRAADLIEKLEEQAHYANGVADLAMKHRDYAEQRVEKLEAALREVLSWVDQYSVDAAYDDHWPAIEELARNALEGKDD